MDDPRLLDDRSVADGQAPEKAVPPSAALVEHRHLGVGSDWVGVGRGNSWRFIRLADVTAVAVVPVSSFKQWFFDRLLYAPGPDLVIRDVHERVIEVDVRRVSTPVRDALVNGLNNRQCISPTAHEFLTTGALPGRYSKSLGYGGSRFGPDRRQ